ncbi:hypothetical protein [Nostoc sp.]
MGLSPRQLRSRKYVSLVLSYKVAPLQRFWRVRKAIAHPATGETPRPQCSAKSPLQNCTSDFRLPTSDFFNPLGQANITIPSPVSQLPIRY